LGRPDTGGGRAFLYLSTFINYFFYQLLMMRAGRRKNIMIERAEFPVHRNKRSAEELAVGVRRDGIGANP
jgi:hypothetical protein